MMMNYVRPTSGTATILGMDSRSQSGKLKKMVGYVPSEVDYYMDMRAMEVIRYAAAMRGLRDKSRIDQLCDLFEVDTVRRISHMSLGLSLIHILLLLQGRIRPISGFKAIFPTAKHSTKATISIKP